MELRRYISIVRRRLLLILMIVVAALAAGYFITPRAKTYTATSTLYVGSRSIDTNPASGQVSGDRVAGFDRLIKTFNAMLRSRPVASAAASGAGVDRSPSAIESETSAAQVENTNLIRVSVTDTDPATARSLINALSGSFVRQIRDFEPRNDPNSDPILSLYESASTPGPNPSPLLRNLALAGLLGLVVAAGVVALLEYLDISLRSSDDVERHLELPVLGVIPALGDHLPATPARRVRNVRVPPAPGTERNTPVG